MVYHYRVSLNHRNLSKEYGGDFGRQTSSIICRLECDRLMMHRALTKVNLREPIRKKRCKLARFPRFLVVALGRQNLARDQSKRVTKFYRAKVAWSKPIKPADIVSRPLLFVEQANQELLAGSPAPSCLTHSSQVLRGVYERLDCDSATTA